jgi:hypothetical protein
MITCGGHRQADQDGRRVGDGAVAWFKTAVVMHAELSLGCRVLVLLSKDSEATLERKINTVNKKKVQNEK